MNAAAALDRTDLRLLALLQRDGRASNADLAAQVNLSPSACLRRIQRLEASGVVAGYAARLDPQALGLGLQAFVRVQLEKHGAAKLSAIDPTEFETLLSEAAAIGRGENADG